jgi:D-glycero-beta-D-manno-heptose 1-phosphate adenylyltransferase
MSRFENIYAKILDSITLQRNLHIWQLKGKRVVFTNGCFDLIHRGHIDYLSKAADLGDILVIGLNTDHSVSTLKGPNRPVQDELTRALILASMSFVDAVILFDEETPATLIEEVSPDFLVKGSDYKPEEIAGADFVIRTGGKIVTIPFIEGFSTSSIINRIKSE